MDTVLWLNMVYIDRYNNISLVSFGDVDFEIYSKVLLCQRERLCHYNEQTNHITLIRYGILETVNITLYVV